MRKPHHRLSTTLSERKPQITLLTFSLHQTPQSQSPRNLAIQTPPRFAYLISGSVGDSDRIKRLLHAAYHPLNLYFVHLDLECGPEDRADLKGFVGSDKVFSRFGNVRILEEADVVTERGPTKVAMLLHAVAVLLKVAEVWSEFMDVVIG